MDPDEAVHRTGRSSWKRCTLQSIITGPSDKNLLPALTLQLQEASRSALPFATREESPGRGLWRCPHPSRCRCSRCSVAWTCLGRGGALCRAAPGAAPRGTPTPNALILPGIQPEVLSPFPSSPVIPFPLPVPTAVSGRCSRAAPGGRGKVAVASPSAASALCFAL